MSKKKFSAGLDDLFSDFHDSSDGGAISEISVRQVMDRKPAAVKSFSNNLDALLQDAMEESLDRMDDGKSHAAASSKTKSRMAAMTSRGFSGLDTLIRETIDVQELTREESSGIKRLTVAVDRTKLEQLKTIARLENSFLKDLLVELIDEYITEYTQEKGLEL